MAAVQVQSVTKKGDLLTITGTVDGVAYTSNAWFSHVSTLGTSAAKRAYCAQRLKDVADNDAPGADQGISGSVTL